MHHPLGCHAERGATVAPDARVHLGDTARARAEDHALQDGAPDPPRKVDDRRVAQEFAKELANRLGRGRFRRPEIYEQQMWSSRSRHGGADYC